jgi:hypothetical protein
LDTQVSGVGWREMPNRRKLFPTPAGESERDCWLNE